MDRKSKRADNPWGSLIALRDQQREDRRTGIQVIKESELPLENNAQGLVRRYLHPAVKGTALTTLMFFMREIPPRSRSGHLKFQGGKVMLILEGRGYTTFGGVKHAWEAGDIVNLPLRTDRIVVQHFNSDSETIAKFAAAEPNWSGCIGVDRGCGFELSDESPGYHREGPAE